MEANFEERVIRYTAIKVFMAVYENVVDEEDPSLDTQLKLLIDLFLDMVKHPKLHQNLLVRK